MERTTLGDLADWEPPPEEQNQFSRFIQIIDKHYPENWRSWEINNVDYYDLFGDKISSDDECRLRFAIPTVELASLLSESPTSLSERRYRSIKRLLLKWPIGRATIYCPLSTMKIIHPTEAVSGFLSLLPYLKPKLLARAEADKIIKSERDRSSSSASSAENRSLKRVHSPDGRAHPSHEKRSKSSENTSEVLLNALQHQSSLLQKLLDLQSNKKDEDPQSSSHDNDSVLGNEPSESEEESWCAPSLEGQEPQEEQEEVLHLHDFDPDTNESETKIGAADEKLLNQVKRCQRFDLPTWQNIRYAEVQKKSQAEPAFTSLKVNAHLATVTPPWPLVSALEKMDLCLGAITNGILQQRREFQEIYQKAPLEVKKVISKDFLSTDSSFRKTSDTLLQYVCGKRAEVLQQRRAIYKPPNKILSDLLHAIPPSPTHLFAEPHLSELVKDQGGINKFFPGKAKFKKPNKEFGGARREFKDKRPTTDSHNKKFGFRFGEKKEFRGGNRQRPSSTKQGKPKHDGKKL